MSYVPTNWKSGDVVTSAKLNKMEQGIADSSGDSSGGSVEIIEASYTDNGMILGKTAKEIADLMKSGKLVFARLYEEDVNFYSCMDLHINSMTKYKDTLSWNFTASSPDEDFQIFVFIAETDNDYPTADLTSEDDSGGNNSGGGTNPR